LTKQMKCKRCGQCCETVAISVSPKELKQHYMDWSKNVKDKHKVAGIDLIYPMLKYIGYDRKVGKYRYRCRFLETKGKIKSCGIHDIKPNMCSSYGLREKFKMGIEGSANQRLYPKCVF